jgi:putative methylase
MLSKSSLAIKLSKLKAFDNPDLQLEQYPTDSEVAAELLWTAYMRGDISEQVIADLGAGTGILGIGALILGAKEVHFIEKDAGALKVLSENIIGYEAIVYEKDISAFDKKVDVVIQNPPFGTKERHADSEFLKKAFTLAPVVYSLHMAVTKDHLFRLAEVNGFSAEIVGEYRFPLKKMHRFHTRKVHRVDVVGVRFSKLPL